MIGMHQTQERGDDIGNSISAGGMQIEAHARVGGREKEREGWMKEGGREGGGILGGMWPASDHVCCLD